VRAKPKGPANERVHSDGRAEPTQRAYSSYERAKIAERIYIVNTLIPYLKSFFSVERRKYDQAKD